MNTYWIVFAVICAAFAIEVAAFLRNMQLIRRANSRELRRRINRYCG